MNNPAVLEEITRAVIQAVLGADIAAKYTQGKLSVNELSAATGKISGFREMFVNRNQEFGNYLTAENQLNAYTLYYLFPNLAKVSAILDFCLERGWLTIKNGLKIADIGCGPGVGLLGVLNQLMASYLPEEFPSLQLSAIDQSAQALKLAERIVANLPLKTLSLKLSTANLENPECAILTEKQDLIILANVVNELFRKDNEPFIKRSTFLRKMIDAHLADKGLLIIIEPALQKTSRELIAVRDLLLTDKNYTVLAPCTQQKGCPLNNAEHAEDWCHEAHYWDNPALIDQIDKLTGLNKHHIKYSFLIIGKAADFQTTENLNYTIETPLYSKGCMKVKSCGEHGLTELVYTAKSKSDKNRQFKKIEKGSRFYFVNTQPEEKKIRITPEMKVEVE